MSRDRDPVGALHFGRKNIKSFYLEQLERCVDFIETVVVLLFDVGQRRFLDQLLQIAAKSANLRLQQGGHVERIDQS